MPEKKHLLRQVFLFLFFAGVYLYLGWPGLQGGFILDDFPNLSELSRVKDWSDRLAYSFSGLSSSVGRPFAHFTFALQSDSWPSDPFSFKLVNLCIHLINALLVLVVSHFISGLAGIHRRALFSGICTVIWLFLPIHTTTIFYVVQRMNLLAVTFTLIGILGFLYGTQLAMQDQRKRGIWIASLAMAIGYALGVLSKENAISLGLFVVVLYLLLVRGALKSNRRFWDIWTLIFALAPIVTLVVYLALDSRYLSGYRLRNFSPEERVMTEWRILWDYVFKVLIPTPESINLFNDNVSVSRSLSEPLTTLFSLIAWCSAFLMGWLWRRSAPYLLFALLWFWGGHLLESTIIGLELYFEHRNYLPSLGLVLAAVWCLFDLSERLVSRFRVRAVLLQACFLGFFAAYIAWLMMVFSVEADSWKDDTSFAMAAVRDRPDSLRANQTAVSDLVRRGDYRGATLFLHEIDLGWPTLPSTYIWLIYLNCLDRNVVLPDALLLEDRLSSGRYDRGAEQAFNEIYQVKSKGACEGMSWEQYRQWLSLLMKNPNFPRHGNRRNLLRLTIFSYMAEGKFDEGIRELDAYPKQKADIDTLKLKAELLYLAGRHADALELILYVEERFMSQQNIWVQHQKYFSNLERKVRAGLVKAMRGND